MKLFHTIIFIWLIATTAWSQISITNNGTSPDSSAMLDIQSTTRGLLIPRMNSSQRQGIPNPAPGLTVFDTTTMSFWCFTGAWSEGLGINDQDWDRDGNVVFNDADSISVGLQEPNAAVHIAAGKDVLFGEDVTGEGYKAIWYASKGAFRAGYLNNPFGGFNYHKFWDIDSVGYYSFAAGQNSRAKGFGSFAFGSFGWADGSGSVAFFGQAKGSGSYSFGGNSEGSGSFTVEGTALDDGGIAMYGTALGRYGVSIGGGTTGLGASSSRKDYAVAIGWNSDARGVASIAFGPSDAYGYNALSTGWVTEARGNYSSTFGYRTISYPYASMALGRYNLVSGDSASWVSTDPVFIVGDGTSNSNRSNSFVIQKNGQTAIGYNTPTGMLQVSSALGGINGGGATINFQNATLLLGSTTTGIVFDANQMESVGSTLYLNFNSPEDIILAAGGGQIGIGTSTPDTDVEVEQASGVHTRFTSLDNSDVMLDFKRNGSDWRINNSSGLLLIGQSNDNLSTVTDVLRLGGSSVAPASDNAIVLGLSTRRWTEVWAVDGSINTSDARLKRNVRSLNYGLSTINQLRPVRFRWADAASSPGDRLGFLAQDLQKIMPEVVVDHAWKYDEETGAKEWMPVENLGVRYAEIIPVLVQAVQELSMQNKHLQKELDELKEILLQNKDQASNH